MSILHTEQLDLLYVEDTLWVLSKSIAPNYDFDFRAHFDCQEPSELPEPCIALSRAGPRPFYKAFYDAVLADGVQLIHDYKMHQLCTSLPSWYPLITEFTPRSMWFDEVTDFETIKQHFELPIFVRGSIKTKRHSKSLSIVETREDYESLREIYSRDPILRYQRFVCREYVSLRKVADVDGDAIPASFEFRTFWWRGQLVGSGRYWVNVSPYNWTESERAEGIAIAQQVADRLPVPFLAVDMGQTVEGEWIVIEVNDGQDCGYPDMSPVELWRNIIDAERNYLDTQNR